MEMKNGKKEENQDKSKSYAHLRLRYFIQETIKIYAPAIFDIAKG